MEKDKSRCGKLNIGLDLDGVIIDHTQSKIKTARCLGFKIKPQETQSEMIRNIIPIEKYKKLQKVIYGRMTLDAPPTPLVLKTLKRLSKDYEVFIISRRGKRWVSSARGWLRKYKIFKIIPKKNIVFVEKEGDKNFWCQKLKIKVFIDDKLKVLKTLSFVPHPIFYNLHQVSINKKFLEIKSWKELPGLLKKI